jgi:hypothetical protein
MHQSVRTALKVLASALLGLFSIPMLGYGAYLFVCWFRIHTSDVYYANYPYATSALVWFGVGLLSLWSTLHGVWRRSFYGFLMAVPVFLGLGAMVSIPDLLPRGDSMIADTNYLSDVNSFFRVWYENNHRFPSSEAEFRDALRKGPEAWQYRVGPAPASPYSQRGNPLPYEIVVETDANAPRLTDVSQRPGVIYYCVSKDLQEFWVTMTGLQSDVARTAHIKRVGGLPEDKIWLVYAAGREYPVKNP